MVQYATDGSDKCPHKEILKYIGVAHTVHDSRTCEMFIIRKLQRHFGHNSFHFRRNSADLDPQAAKLLWRGHNSLLLYRWFRKTTLPEHFFCFSHDILSRDTSEKQHHLSHSLSSAMLIHLLGMPLTAPHPPIALPPPPHLRRHSKSLARRAAPSVDADVPPPGLQPQSHHLDEMKHIRENVKNSGMPKNGRISR